MYFYLISWTDYEDYCPYTLFHDKQYSQAEIETFFEDSIVPAYKSYLQYEESAYFEENNKDITQGHLLIRCSDASIFLSFIVEIMCNTYGFIEPTYSAKINFSGPIYDTYYDGKPRLSNKVSEILHSAGYNISDAWKNWQKNKD